MDLPQPAASTPPGPSLAVLSFEDALKRLETIVQRLESGEASLEDSIGLYTEGQALKAHCDAKLSDATMRIEAIQANDAGVAVGTKPFDSAPSESVRAGSAQPDSARSDNVTRSGISIGQSLQPQPSQPQPSQPQPSQQ